jgi:LAO/AO transport system kinase
MQILSFKENSKEARRILSKGLTEIENSLPKAQEISNKAFQSSHSAKVFGITGAPGVGKSSLINLLIESFVADGLSIAILAVDPSSPFTGGSLLGDRTRMHSNDLYPYLYIRSSSTRGHLGGISPKTPEMLSLINAFQFDIIIIETVGVGQAELDIMKCADLTAVVLSPNMGDSLQALKAGLIEISDLFILNKADIPAISELEKDIIFSLSLGSATSKRPEIVKTSCINPQGIDLLKKSLLECHEKLSKSGEIALRRKSGLEFQLEVNLRECLSNLFNKNKTLNSKKSKIKEKIYAKKISPRDAALDIFKDFEKI